MRCAAILEYFTFVPGQLCLVGDLIEDTGFVRCVLLAEHVGNHRALVPDKGDPVEWPQR